MDSTARPGASSLFRGSWTGGGRRLWDNAKSQRHLGQSAVRKLLADNFPPRTFQDATTNYPQSRATMQVFLLPNGVLRGRRQAHRRQNAPPKEWTGDLLGLPS